MSWILGAIYCLILWLVFAKLKLLRLTLPVAILAASVGPGLIVALLFCAQYYHPFTSRARVFQQVIPIVPQLNQPGRVSQVSVVPNRIVQEGEVLFTVDAVPYQNRCDRFKAQLTQVRQGEEVARASIELAEASLARATANLDYANAEKGRVEKIKLANPAATSEAQMDSSVNRVAEGNAAVRQAEASLIQTRLAAESAVAKIDEMETQLADAMYDLEQTTIRAPGDGYITNLQLRPGMLVGGGGSSAVMTFVINRDDQNTGMVVATFGQKNFLRIKEGNYAEVALNAYPGQIWTGRVVNTIDVSGAGQMQASGELPDEIAAGKATNFAVRIKLDDADSLRLPAGAQAQVAVYTEDVQIAGIPIMFLIRVKSWMHYLF